MQTALSTKEVPSQYAVSGKSNANGCSSEAKQEKPKAQPRIDCASLLNQTPKPLSTKSSFAFRPLQNSLGLQQEIDRMTPADSCSHCGSPPEQQCGDDLSSNVSIKNGSSPSLFWSNLLCVYFVTFRVGVSSRRFLLVFYRSLCN